MPAVTREEAVDLLTKAIENDLYEDELVDVYTELFSRAPPPGEGSLREAMVKHVHGLASDVLVAMWPLFCPKDRNVWYNEEEERIYYNEGLEAFASE